MDLFIKIKIYIDGVSSSFVSESDTRLGSDPGVDPGVICSVSTLSVSVTSSSS